MTGGISGRHVQSCSFNRFIYSIGVLCDTQECFPYMMEASIMVGGNQSVSTVTQDHPQVAGRPFHIRPEGTQARARHELTGNALVRDFRVLAQAVLALNAARVLIQ